MFKKIIADSMAKSPWIYHINTGSCNGCDIELVAVLTPRYDAERFGFKLAGTPRHADIIVVSGPITSQSKDRLLRTLEQVPEPRCVVSLGSCPRSCNVFKGSYSVEGPLEQYVHVDVSVAGCTPKPEAVIEGLYTAAQILKEKRLAMSRGEYPEHRVVSTQEAAEETETTAEQSETTAEQSETMAEQSETTAEQSAEVVAEQTVAEAAEQTVAAGEEVSAS